MKKRKVVYRFDSLSFKNENSNEDKQYSIFERNDSCFVIGNKLTEKKRKVIRIDVIE